MVYAVLLVGCLFGMGSLFLLMNRDEPVFIEAADRPADGFSVFMMVVLAAASLWLIWHILW